MRKNSKRVKRTGGLLRIDWKKLHENELEACCRSRNEKNDVSLLFPVKSPISFSLSSAQGQIETNMSSAFSSPVDSVKTACSPFLACLAGLPHPCPQHPSFFFPSPMLPLPSPFSDARHAGYPFLSRFPLEITLFGSTLQPSMLVKGCYSMLYTTCSTEFGRK